MCSLTAGKALAALMVSLGLYSLLNGCRAEEAHIGLCGSRGAIGDHGIVYCCLHPLLGMVLSSVYSSPTHFHLSPPSPAPESHNAGEGDTATSTFPSSS